MHVYMYNIFNIYAILVHVTYLMYDYIYYYCMHQYSVEQGLNSIFTKLISRNTVLMLMHPIY